MWAVPHLFPFRIQAEEAAPLGTCILMREEKVQESKWKYITAVFLDVEKRHFCLPSIGQRHVV
jgi:hypothetical protein